MLSHLKHVTCSRYAKSCSGPCASESHCCSAGTWVFDRACIRPRPSRTLGRNSRDSLFWNICTRFSFSLLGHAGLLWDAQQHFVRLLLAMFFSHGCLGPGPWQVSLWVLGYQHPAVFFFFTAIWRVFHPTFCSPPGCVVVSSTTSSDFNINFSLNPWYQLNSDVTGFGNTQASKENASHHLPRIPGCPILCRCTESAAPAQC